MKQNLNIFINILLATLSELQLKLTPQSYNFIRSLKKGSDKTFGCHGYQNAADIFLI